MELFNRVFNDLVDRKHRIDNGLINSIPFNLPRFSSVLPGIEQGTYTLVTANTKVGKSQLTDWLYVFTPFFYAFNHREQVRIKIFYFTLEMSKEQKYRQFMSHLLYILSRGKIRIAPKDLRSTNASYPIPEEVLEILSSDEYKPYFEFFEECVEFIDSIRNPTGIFKFAREYAQNHGTQHTKTIDFIDNNTKETTPTVVDDYYEPDDPDEYKILIVDHLSLISTEADCNTLHAAISKLSSKYFVQLRNKYKYTIVAVQQQQASQEGNENFKLDKLRPTTDGLGDNKLTGRDCDLALGLYAPYRYGKTDHGKYDITKFRDNIRFMELMVGREGGGNAECPLYFDGAVNYFSELPEYDNKEALEKYYKLIRSNASHPEPKISLLLTIKQHNRGLLKNYLNMSRILGLAPSGFGKSTGIKGIPELGHKGLDPKTTFVISVLGKPLPWRGSQKDYVVTDYKKPTAGNRIISNDPDVVATILTQLASPECPYKTIVIDDFNYLMQDYYMANALKGGWDTPKKIGAFMGRIFDAIDLYQDPNPKNIIVLAHGEEVVKPDNRVYVKLKTTGKMVDEYVTPEGKFDITIIGKSRFDASSKTVVKEYLTNEDEFTSSAKSPYGMFNSLYVPNDLGYIVETADEYYKG